MKVRSVTEYRTPAGERRRIRLYGSWVNMRGRVSGRLHAGNGARPWRGLQVEWKTFTEFRAWALSHGYTKRFCSLDRIDPSKGYGPRNCRWLTVADNTRWQNYHHGAELPDVPF